MKKYQAEPEEKRVAKRQRYWKSSEPGCLAEVCYTGSINIYLERHRKTTTNKVTQMYVVHVHVSAGSYLQARRKQQKSGQAGVMSGWGTRTNAARGLGRLAHQAPQKPTHFLQSDRHLGKEQCGTETFPCRFNESTDQTTNY